MVETALFLEIGRARFWLIVCLQLTVWRTWVHPLQHWAPVSSSNEAAGPDDPLDIFPVNFL